MLLRRKCKSKTVPILSARVKYFFILTRANLRFRINTDAVSVFSLFCVRFFLYILGFIDYTNAGVKKRF